MYISAAGPCECVMHKHKLTRDLCLKTDKGSMMNLDSPEIPADRQRNETDKYNERGHF